MFEISWIQDDATIIQRQLPETLGFHEYLVSTAVKDLFYCIAYNEDSQLSNLDFFKPLHLEVRFEYWSESVTYSSLQQKSVFQEALPLAVTYILFIVSIQYISSCGNQSDSMKDGSFAMVVHSMNCFTGVC